MAELHVWIPTNRAYKSGKPKGMDALNEIIGANRSHRQKGARIERENVKWCAWFIKRAMYEQRWAAMSKEELSAPCDVTITFVEANERRDVSNVIGGGLKYALDALSRPRGGKDGAAAIYDDSPKWLHELRTSVRVDPENPGIDITVKECS